MKKQNQKFIMNGSDKNLGAAAAEKKDVITECTRQLYGINPYVRMSWEEAELIQMDLLEMVNKNVRGKFSKRILQ